jgi:hypothetical protein
MSSEEELHDFHYWPNIIRMIKSRRATWERNVARMGRCGMRKEFGVKNRRKETTKIL